MGKKGRSGTTQAGPSTQRDIDDDEAVEDTRKETEWKYSGDLSKQQQIEYGGKIARYFLTCEARCVPVTRNKIKEHVLSHYLPQATQMDLKACMIQADKYLQDVFGLQMKLSQMPETVNMTQYGVKAKGWKSSDTEFYLKNQFNYSQINEVFEYDDREQANFGLLCTVLAIIYLAQNDRNDIEEESLFSQLENLGITKDQPDLFIGKLKGLLTSWRAQRYIRRIEESKHNVFYHWGERAHQEIGKLGILQFIQAVYGDNAHPELEQMIEELKVEKGLNVDPTATDNAMT
eukprot:Clim_evm22s55 gene=Clim_evmTU22s55